MRWDDLPEISHHVAARPVSGAAAAACGAAVAPGYLVEDGDWDVLRELRERAVLCPACQQAAGLRHVALQRDRYGGWPRSRALLYGVGLLGALDRCRNCPGCRSGGHAEGVRCAEAHGLARAERALWEECRRWVRRSAAFLELTGWSTADLFLYGDGSVAYYARLAPLWQESGELTGAALAVAVDLLESGGRPGPKDRWGAVPDGPAPPRPEPHPYGGGRMMPSRRMQNPPGTRRG